jgi:hypothetical protein
MDPKSKKTLPLLQSLTVEALLRPPTGEVQDLRGGDPSDVGARVAAEDQDVGRRGNTSISAM